VDGDDVGVDGGEPLLDALAPGGGGGAEGDGAEIEAADEEEAAGIVDAGGAERVFEEGAGAGGVGGLATGEAQVAHAAVVAGSGGRGDHRK
jgi:hypothetical protein